MIWPSEALLFSWQNGSLIYFKNMNQCEKNEGILWNNPDSKKISEYLATWSSLSSWQHLFEQRYSCPLQRDRVYKVSHSPQRSLVSVALGPGVSCCLNCTHIVVFPPGVEELSVSMSLPKGGNGKWSFLTSSLLPHCVTSLDPAATCISEHWDKQTSLDERVE